jgi:prepilin-type N-terminal cleavage/methylation domain-containing protein
MNRIKNSGFTLVELMITIAMVAILATVTFVGFSNYITKARLSKDFSDIAEINNVIEAMKVEESFVAPKNLADARSLIEDITAERFSYRSRVDGYHFWFNISRSEVMLSTVEDMEDYNDSYRLRAPQTELLRYSEQTTPLHLLPEGFLYTDERPVIFLEREGSPLADAIAAFDSVTDYESYVDLRNRLDHNRLPESAREELLARFNQTAFITNHGNFSLGSHPAKRAVFAHNVTEITNRVIDLDANMADLSQENPLLDLNHSLEIPNQIESIMTNALMDQNENSDFELIFDRSITDISAIVEPGFTNLRFKTDEGLHAIENHRILQGETELSLTLNYHERYAVQSFDVVLDDEVIRQDNIRVQLQQEVVLTATNFINRDLGPIVSSKDITYQTSDEQIATVDHGIISFIEIGRVSITMTPIHGQATRTIDFIVVEDELQDESVYEFNQIDMDDFDYDDRYTQTENGMVSHYGLFFIEHDLESYSIRVKATLDALNEGTKGGYGILFDTILHDDLKDSGYALQFDRGYQAIVIRPRVYGGERNPILSVDHHDIDWLPDSKRASFWTEEHVIQLDVTPLPGDSSKRVLNVYIDQQVVIEDYVFEATVGNGTSVTGLRAWHHETEFVSLSIKDLSQIGADFPKDDEASNPIDRSKIVSDMLEADLFNGTRTQYSNSYASADSWSKRIEAFLEINADAQAYANRYGYKNPVGVENGRPYNQEAVINWVHMDLSEEFHNPAFFITGSKHYAYENMNSEHKHFDRLLGTIIFYKTESNSDEVFHYQILSDGTISDLEAFNLQ